MKLLEVIQIGQVGTRRRLVGNIEDVKLYLSQKFGPTVNTIIILHVPIKSMK